MTASQQGEVFGGYTVVLGMTRRPAVIVEGRAYRCQQA